MKLLKNHWFFKVFSMGRRESSAQNTYIYKAILNMKLLKNHWFFNVFSMGPRESLAQNTFEYKAILNMKLLKKNIGFSMFFRQIDMSHLISMRLH